MSVSGCEIAQCAVGFESKIEPLDLDQDGQCFLVAVTDLARKLIDCGEAIACLKGKILTGVSINALRDAQSACLIRLINIAGQIQSRSDSLFDSYTNFMFNHAIPLLNHIAQVKSGGSSNFSNLVESNRNAILELEKSVIHLRYVYLSKCPSLRDATKISELMEPASNSQSPGYPARSTSCQFLKFPAMKRRRVAPTFPINSMYPTSQRKTCFAFMSSWVACSRMFRP